jgi:glycosyltransferase involved in cell wall biosynthesis
MHSPLVSVLTPAYNGARYIAECIESVLNQRYDSWEYIIVDNSSTDATLDIATGYAARDSRIRVVSNRQFVGVIENHNIAFKLISPKSAYCKVVSADDWINRDCIERLVRLAQAHPSVGIAGSYQLSDEQVRWTGLSPNTEVISGREVCRLSLLEGLDVFGTPTSNLYRSSLVRGHEWFLPHSLPYADTSACYKYLQHCDFGFVHEILSAERVHNDRVTATTERLSMGAIGYLENLLEYGPIYLAPTEFKTRKKEAMERYYRFLGGCVLKMREKEFWSFHSRRLRELGHPIPWGKVMRGAVDEVMDEMRDPMVALRKLASVLRQRAIPLPLRFAKSQETGKNAKKKAK